MSPAAESASVEMQLPHIPRQSQAGLLDARNVNRPGETFATGQQIEPPRRALRSQ